MDTIRLHGYHGLNDGTQDCDYRGDKFIGEAQGDTHRTIAEIDDDGTIMSHEGFGQFVDEVLREGPKINGVLSRLRVNAPVIGTVALRLGVWDKDVPQHTPSAADQ